MDLEEYLVRYSVKRKAFAARCGICFNTLNFFLKNRRDIHLSIAKRIAEATGYEVTLNDLAAHVAHGKYKK